MSSIDLVVEKYIGESKEKKEMEKVLKTIESSKSTEQLSTAIKMASAYIKKYGEDSFFRYAKNFFLGRWKDDDTKAGMLTNKFLDIINQKKKKLEHEEMVARVQQFKADHF